MHANPESNFPAAIKHSKPLLSLAMLMCCMSASAAPAEELNFNAAAKGPAGRMSRYNVVWTSPSKDASGVMPIGNGDLAAGVYAIEDGDLYLLLAKNDAFNFNGDIYKTGRVRISLDPNPFKTGKPFRQVLDLPTGSIRIEADGVALRVWADANRPVYHIEIHSPGELAVTARPEFWERLDKTREVCVERTGNILWYFPVGDRSIYPDEMKPYAVEQMVAKLPDPYRFNTFGNLLESPALQSGNGVLAGSGTAFDIRIHACAMQTPDATKWIETSERQAALPVNAKSDWDGHCAWWQSFWDRSWIVSSDNTVEPEAREQFSGEPSPAGTRDESDGAALAAQSYNVFRFLMACQSRGRVQTKFNGGLFTQQLRVGAQTHRPAAARQTDGSWLTHEDDRLWGRRFTYQNQRLLYWPMLASGDFDLMKPFFDAYSNLLEMRQAITKAWFGHDGAYFRENISPTGSEWDCDKGSHPPKTQPGETYEGWYHDYYFTAGLETVAMMTDYVSHTGDAAFRERVLVPFAREILLFFDQHYPRGTDGKIRLDPAQVLETYWIAVNPAPDVAGLRFTLDGLLAMPAGTAQDLARWRRFRGEIPQITLREVEGRMAIAPAEKYEKQCNSENGELYPVFPFRCFGLGLGSADIVAWTMRHRSNKDSFGCGCWTQDQIHWAYAGNAAEAAAGLVRRARIASNMCRFPLYGREGPDSCPDFDQFGAGSIALQRMLVQEAGDKIFLLPAWPADWDADFKLHLTGGTTLTGTVKDGKLLAWDIQPSARRDQVVVCQPQSGATTGPAVPPNDHPLRAGSDQAGSNRFEGNIGRVTMFRGELSPLAIRELASGERSKPVASEQVVATWFDVKAGDTLATQAGDFSGPVSFEAWIQPADNEAGRVLDKITAGGHDGFLLDTWPMLGLRLIVGDRQCTFENVLKPAVWQHVAVVIGCGTQRVYLDGTRIYLR